MPIRLKNLAKRFIWQIVFFEHSILTMEPAKVILIFLIIFVFCLIWPVSAQGVSTYYVAKQSPDGCNDNWPGMENQPWSTIQKATNTLRAGDTVLIHKGVYPE